MFISFLSSRRTLAIGVALAVASAALMAGCDFLDKPPRGELPQDQFFQNAEDAEAATNATYNELRDFSVHVFAWLGMTDIASDDAMKGSNPGDAAELIGSLDELTWSTANGSFSQTWSGYYSGIYRANQAIQNIPPIDMDPDLKDRLVAENRFLRAYYYFFLVRAYGGVPKLTEPVQVSQIDGVTRAPQDSIYALIERDLEFAASNLPEKGNIQTGRATSGAAQGFLAKVHLFQEEYDQALTAAESVIEESPYDLADDYFTIFREEGEFGPGSLFEVASADLAQGGGTVQYAQFQGVRGTPNLGFGFNQPSPDLEASYEPGDPRQQATILYPWEAIPDGSGAVVHVNTELTNQRYNEKAQAQNDNDNFNVTVNVRRLRYADVLLIAAEAAARTNQEGLARGYVNDVRDRAREGRTLTVGLQPEQMPSQIAEVLGVADSGPHVMARFAAGPAATAGVESFDAGRFENSTPVPAIVNQVDVIEAVNGTEITTVEGYVDAIDNAGDGGTVTLDVLRLSQTASNGSLSTSSQTLTVDATAERLLPDITSSGSSLIRDIWQERRHELAMEQHRWFDIIRQGRAEQLMEDVGKDWQDRYTRYPIPQTEVDRAGLDQNPGYGGG
jgi:tetratricopeptide (TPR) repeat protein